MSERTSYPLGTIQNPYIVDDDNAVSMGRVLYNVYSSWVDYKAWNGEPLKPFKDLPSNIRHAWEMVAFGKFKDRPSAPQLTL